MLRLYSGLFGLCGLAIGLVHIFWGAEIPQDIRLDGQSLALLFLISAFLTYYGRKYLLMWIGYSVSGDDD